MVAVKICCIASIEEAEYALAHSADAIGLVSAMPSGPGPIPDALIAAIIAGLPPDTDSFLLTSRTDAMAIIEQARALNPRTLQLVDTVAPNDLAELRRALPGTRLVQVLHVVDDGVLDQARAVAPLVDAILLDSGNPNAAVKELGGTGRTHDWSLSRRLVEAVARPVYLAGGLRPDNVARAVAAVEPYGVDVCSGVRSGGKLDPAKLTAFVAATTSR